MIIDTVDASEVTLTSSWSAIWLAAEQATARCVRDGNGGNISVPATVVGHQSTDVLRVTIMDEPGSLELVGKGSGLSERQKLALRHEDKRLG